MDDDDDDDDEAMPPLVILRDADADDDDDDDGEFRDETMGEEEPTQMVEGEEVSEEESTGEGEPRCEGGFPQELESEESEPSCEADDDASRIYPRDPFQAPKNGYLRPRQDVVEMCLALMQYFQNFDPARMKTLCS